MLSVSCLLGQAQIEQYGPFVGGNLFLYKSNLYNSQDLHADSVQHYQITPGFGLSFDFGYRYLNGLSIQSGLSYGSSGQHYNGKDSVVGDVVTFSAKTNMSFIKVPLIFSMTTRNDKPVKAFYSVGIFAALNTGFSESFSFDFAHAVNASYTTTITKETYEVKYKNDTAKHAYNLNERPYRSLGWGAILALGASKRMNKKTEGFMQLKMEYQLSSSENTDQMIFTPQAGTADSKHLGYVWGNYAKYMHHNGNYNRPATHPFNLGLTFGIRHFIFDFD